MNAAFVPLVYAVASVPALWLALLCCARLPSSRRARLIKLLFGVATILLLFVPIGGLPLWNRAFSFYPNPSLPMLGILCAALWQRLLSIPVFTGADWRAIWCFGAVIGSVLYLHPMVVGAVDLYYWGWERESATWALAAVAIGLLACGSRLGVLLLAALIGYAVNALESQNCWDYVMDPIFWLASMTMTTREVVARWSRRGEAGGPAPAAARLVEGLVTSTATESALPRSAREG